jgi:hypothetical protein
LGTGVLALAYRRPNGRASEIRSTPLKANVTVKALTPAFRYTKKLRHEFVEDAHRD